MHTARPESTKPAQGPHAPINVIDALQLYGQMRGIIGGLTERGCPYIRVCLKTSQRWQSSLDAPYMTF